MNFHDDQRRTGQGFQDGVLAALDAARNLHFAFAREQRDGAHLPQVHAHGVVDLLAEAGGQLQVEQIFAFFELFLEILGLFEDLDACAIQTGEHVLQLRAARKLAGQYFADFVVEDVSLFLAQLNEPLQPVVFVIYRH